MKRALWLMGLLLAGTLATHAADVRFFRITGPTSTVITALSADGTVMWTNNEVGVTCAVESAYSTGLDPIWERYSQVTVTSSVTRLRIIDPNPPAGMVLIPAGSFAMGDAFGEGDSEEFPQHTVNVSPFYMDIYDVTKALWDEVKAFNGGNGYTYSNTGLGKAPNHPVHTVDWYDVVKWCNARSEREGLTPCYSSSGAVYRTGIDSNVVCNWSANGYRLPTEAEWEKAARSGAANARFPWTDYTNKISWAKANYYASTNNFKHDYSYDLSGGTGAFHSTFATGGEPYTSPVDYFAPNGYGLHDMAGNVWQWCWDWYDSAYYSSSPGTDPRGPASSPVARRIVRGGSWYINPAFYLRVANRSDRYPVNANYTTGFRCARGL